MCCYTFCVRRGFRRWVFALALAGVGMAAAPRNPDPAESLARVRLIVTTKAATAAVTVDGATIASYISSVLDGSPAVSVSRTGRTLRLSGNVPGQSAEAASTSSSPLSAGGMVNEPHGRLSADTQLGVFVNA